MSWEQHREQILIMFNCFATPLSSSSNIYCALLVKLTQGQNDTLDLDVYFFSQFFTSSVHIYSNLEQSNPFLV